jgi:DNA-binding IclR family transcriptional regulator
MREVGFLDQDRTRDQYRLGLKLLELGNLTLASMDLHREARIHVESLQRITGAMVNLAVFDGYRAVAIHRYDPTLDEVMRLNLLESAPLHCTSVGKAMLAFQSPEVVARIVAAGLERFTDTTIVDGNALAQDLAATRQRGYSIDNGEHQPGLRCIGAPIRDQQGRVIAAISASGSSWKVPPFEDNRIADVVIHHADMISAALGYRN